MLRMKGNKMPLRDTVYYNLRALLVLYRSCPQMVLSDLIGIAWNNLTPYVRIWLSAQLIGELSGNRDPHTLLQWVLLILVSSALISLVWALLQKWKNTANSSIWYEINHALAKKMLEMDFVTVDDPETHKKLSTIQQSMNGGGWGLSLAFFNFEGIFASVFSLFGGISLTVSLFTSSVPDGSPYGWLNHPLFAVGLVGIMILITWFVPFLRTYADGFFAKMAGQHNMANRLFSFVGWLGFKREYATDVRMYRQDLICDKYNYSKKGLFDSKGIMAKRSLGAGGLLQALAAALSTVFTGLVYLFVCLKAWAGAFGVGAVTQYVSSVTRLSGSITQMLLIFGKMQNNAPHLKFTFDYLDLPNPMYQGSLTVEKRQDRDYEIEFRDVSFRYPGTETYALRHVNLKFRVGERLAVVGKNGSGKTTFIKLLCRLYDPTEGEILLNGIDIRKYDYEEYLSVFSVVFQDFQLFDYPLGQNVGATRDYNRELATSCLERAGFGERLGTMPNGLETYLYTNLKEDGVNLSGGEAQKVALARTLYKDAPFLILDEPTAALDPIAESEVYSRFNEYVGDRTAIYISHRLSSCRFCDEIAVFDCGNLVQKGTHDELVSAEGGKYRELWYAQAQYYQ